MKILSLQRWDLDRGIDRVCEVATYMAITPPLLHVENHPGMEPKFLIAGQPVYTGPLGFDWPSNCEVIGLVEPKDILPQVSVVIRFTRGNDPWGRDCIEAVSAGVPIVATGTWGGIIKHGINGYLIGEYDCVKAVEYIERAALLDPTPDDRFTGENVKRIEAIYESVISR